MLGVPLYPLSVGHLLLFSHYNLCYALDFNEDNEAKPLNYSDYDLLMAILICSHNFNNNIHTLSPKKFKFKYNRLKWKYRFFGDLLINTNDLKNYLEYYLKDIPHTSMNNQQLQMGQTPEAPNRRPMGAPFLELMIAMMEQYYGYSEEYILDMTIGKILWKVLIKAELDGNININDFKFKDVIEEIDKNKEEILKQMPAGMKWID